MHYLKFGGLYESGIWGPEANSDCQEFEKLNFQVIELNARQMVSWWNVINYGIKY